MSNQENFITLSEEIFRIAYATGEWPSFLTAREKVLQATLDGTLTIYGVRADAHLHEPPPPFKANV